MEYAKQNMGGKIRSDMRESGLFIKLEGRGKYRLERGSKVRRQGSLKITEVVRWRSIRHEEKCSLKCMGLGIVAHACNPRTLGSRRG